MSVDGNVLNTPIVSTSTDGSNTSDDYFISSRMDRDNTYSEMLENYQKIIDDANATNDQKNTAAAEIKKINDNKNSIMIVENLIKTKGFEDVVVLVNQDSINIVVKKDSLNSDEVAQIANIITREFNVDISKVHITNK